MTTIVASKVEVWQDLGGAWHASTRIPLDGTTINDAWRLAHDAIREACQATGAFAIRQDGAPRCGVSNSLGAYVMYRWAAA